MRAQADASADDGELQRVAEAASAAIAAGAAPDALKRIARASRRRREANAEYEQEIRRGDRLGLTHREIAAAAEAAHGTVRAIVARTEAASGQALPAPEAVSANGGEPDHG